MNFAELFLTYADIYTFGKFFNKVRILARKG